VRRPREGARDRHRGRVLITLDAIERAHAVTSKDVGESPLVRLDVEAPCEIWLKLECVQPIGSFKLRGAASAIRQAEPGEWRDGVWTTSAGNMAQGVCWMARELGVPATVVAPDHAPQAKLDAIVRLGGRVIPVPFDTWWSTMEDGAYPGLVGLFVHPVLDERVMAGNGVIGLELAERLDRIDAVTVPWGGGGLTTGIASALAAVSPSTRIVACEPETGAPLTASLAAGHPVSVDYRPSFVDGAGGKALLPAMWERAQALVANAVAVPLDDVARAVSLLATRAHVVAEGAGALALAAAMAGHAGDGRVVCIVSGGNIDPGRLTTILAGTVPD
jgi:threonine dehydratase